MFSNRYLVAFVAVASLSSLFGAVGCTVAGEGENVSDPSAETSEDELNTRARFTHLKKPTDRDLAALSTATAKLGPAYRGVYRFNKAGLEATDPQAREKRIKEVMRRHMCPFFDESIDLGRRSGPNAVGQTLADLDLPDNAGNPSAGDIEALSSALAKVRVNRSLDVLSGSASGNNTIGEVLGIYDTAHHEILFFGYTNCGSDG
jgi:hypothetical protein